jgi:hypothetical protein
MNQGLVAVGGTLAAAVAVPRLLFLAPFRVGWAMYLANVAWELLPKKLGVGRFRLEAVAGAAGLALLAIGGAPWSVVALVGGLLLALEIGNHRWEKRLVAGPVPTGAILALEAPFVARRPEYSLGVRWTGVPFDLELVAVNPGPATATLRVRLDAPAEWLGGSTSEQTLRIDPAGGVARATWTLRPQSRQGGGALEIVAEENGRARRIRIEHDGCVPAAEARPVRAEISRYPGGRRSAFVWRGDMDLYDRRTFQSIAGLETTLGLSARYAFPQTMCLSTRLSFDEAAAREWAEHVGAEPGAAEIPRFIQWLREKVELRHAAAFPAKGTGKPFLLELGNHGHLHYDTAAAAAPENGWKSHAKMGAGRYPWMGADASSFGEQRDNILEAARWFLKLLGYVPRSWAKPGRCNDADTARAAAAAGCDVLSGSDIRARDNVLFQPPPHHPGGTDAVELTSRYPPDPQHVHHFAMLRFWLHRSCRLGRPMVFMCHQHMRQWEGPACGRFTEHLLRRALADCHGEFAIDTLFGVGKYWREVLSPQTRRVAVALDGARLRIENRSDADFAQVPVDLDLADGGRTTVLVSVGAGRTVELKLQE